MNYNNVKNFIFKSQKYKSSMSTDNIRELLNRLGRPDKNLKFIHIAGTNGKGSTLAYTSTILQRAGYKVGRFSSPALLSYEERIQINQKDISKDSLIKNAAIVKKACEGMVMEGFKHPTYFEVTTAIGVLYFNNENCDFVVLETGMGGRLDSTNVIETALVSVITSIGLDHTKELGNTYYEIAKEKSGIIKKSTPVVTCNQNVDVLKAIKDTCLQRDAKLYIAEPVKNVIYNGTLQKFDYKNYKNLEISLLGEFQPENASNAIEIIEVLRKKGYKIDNSDVYSGLRETVWSGRFEIILNKPKFIIDGAHNPDAVLKLKQAIIKYFKNQKKTFIISISRGKDYNSMLEIICGIADKIIVIERTGERAIPGVQLADAIKQFNNNCSLVCDIDTAVKEAISSTNEEDVIVAFGSLLYLGEVKKSVLKYKVKKQAEPAL